MLQFPNAKINIGLSVIKRREDGYHNINSVFYPIGLFDALELLPSQSDSYANTGRPVPGAWHQNLLYQALLGIRANYDKARQPMAIHLHKHIPMGAGLGGGSADAAFLLHMLNDYFSLNMQEPELIRHALALGSDVPFFIRNRAAYAEGRGELLQDIRLDLSSYSLQLIYPNVSISTAEAFAGIRPIGARTDLKKLPSIPLSDWKDCIYNDFEPVVFRSHPILASIKEQLYQAGAIYASLSGTGSTVYGIFSKGQRAALQNLEGAEEFYIL